LVSANYQTYKNLVKQNWTNGNINESKIAMLSNLRKTLRITEEEHQQILAELGATLGAAPLQAQTQAPVQQSAPPRSAEVIPTATDMPKRITPAYAASVPLGPISPAPGQVVQTTPQPSHIAPAGPMPAPVAPAPTAQPTIQPAGASRVPQHVGSVHQMADRPETGEPSTIGSGIQRVGPALGPQQAPKPVAGESKPASAIKEPKTPEDYLELGKEAYRVGDYQKALEQCEISLKMKPSNNPQALFFKKRAKSKIEEGAPGADFAKPAEAPQSDLMLSHIAPPVVAPVSPPPAAASGPGAQQCLSCRDTKVCSWCKGTGECWMCHGAKICSNCKGTGKVGEASCPKCRGSGKCDSCLGSGNCYWCKGSGKCHKCSK
jgi:hypothetical protein